MFANAATRLPKKILDTIMANGSAQFVGSIICGSTSQNGENVNVRILLFDCETFPNLGFTWGRYEQDVIRFKQETCMATFVAKWFGEKQVVAKGLPHYKGYRPGSYDDKQLVTELWDLFDEADVICAHNGDDFDIRMANARFIAHGLTPPSPFQTIDTKKIAKRVARFNSNKLDDLGTYLNLGKKIKTDFDLWLGCINGDKASWAKMLRYNTKDVLLLEKLYLQLRPWIKNHPNFTALTKALCPKCNSSEVIYRGYTMSATRQYRRFQCRSCGGWGMVAKAEKGVAAKTKNA